jgi:hypothetical protein
MSESNETQWPADVLERLSGYGERVGKKVGEAVNEFSAWLKVEYSVDNPLSEDPFYLTQWSEQFVIETRNLGGSSGGGRETVTFVGMFIGAENENRDQRANVMERAMSVFKSNRSRAVDEGHIGIVTAKGGEWHVNGQPSGERLQGSDLPWFAFEHNDEILCLLNKQNDSPKPIAPTSVSRTIYFLGSAEDSNEIKKWRVNVQGNNMDAPYKRWTACKIQVVEPKEDRDTLYTNRDFAEKVEYTDKWLPETLRRAFSAERLLTDDNMHNEYVDLADLLEAHGERKVIGANGTTYNPVVITKGYISLLNKEPSESTVDPTGRSYRLNITNLGLQSRYGRDSFASSVTVWIPGRMNDEDHPFEYELDGIEGNWTPYAEKTQVIIVGRLRIRPYKDEMLPSIGALGIYVPHKTARPSGGTGSTNLNQFGGDQQ